VPLHAHHAIQIVIALDGGVAICGKDEAWRESRGIVVRPDAEHSFDCNGAPGVMVFVDPESSEGAWKSAPLSAPCRLGPASVRPGNRLNSRFVQPQ
jgi:quercetin dioxygenase-like cupin family protein